MPVQDSLRIDDTDDLVDLRQDLEQVFALRLADAEAGGCQTVGDILQLVRSRFPANKAADRCLTAMAFYRLRRALSAMGAEARLGTGARLDGVVAGCSVRQLFKQLETRSGLKLPAWQAGVIGQAGVLAMVGGFLALPVAWSIGWRPALGCAAVQALGWALTRIDPGRLPREAATLGSLAQQTACLNPAALHAQGARLREPDLWNALVGVLSRYTAVPAATIRRGTLITRPPLPRVA